MLIAVPVPVDLGALDPSTAPSLPDKAQQSDQLLGWQALWGGGSGLIGAGTGGGGGVVSSDQGSKLLGE